MSNITEKEVFLRLQENIREAVQACNDLAVRSQRGRSYNTLRDRLADIEWCCQKLAGSRGDARWLPIGMKIAVAHKKAGDWLRGWTDPVTGNRVPTAPGELNELFVMLAANLMILAKASEELFTGKTGTLDAILPKAEETRREGRPALVYKPKKSALILPPRLRAANG